MTTVPTHTEIEPCMFLDDAVFATKSGDSGIVLKLSPQDSECMEPEDKDAVARRFEAAMRLLPPGCRICQYMLKRRLYNVLGGDSVRAEYLAAKDLYSFEFYLVLVKPGINAAELGRLAEAFVVQLGELLPAVIEDKGRAYRLFRNLLNYDVEIAGLVGLKYNEFVDYFASDSDVENHGHRGYLTVRDHYAKVLTLKDPPRATAPDILRPLREIPCECIVVWEWKALEMQTVRSIIHSKTSHFNLAKHASNMPKAIVDAISRISGMGGTAKEPASDQKDQGASAMEAELGDLAEDIEKNGTLVGEFALTVIVFDKNMAAVEKAASEAMKAASRVEAVLYAERLNALSAWFAALPAGYKHQRRQMYLTNHNHADLSMLFAPAVGEHENAHLGGDCLAVLETRQRTPHYANLHYGDVGHALFSGNTGSGKSYLANYLVTCAMARYRARVIIFDIGGSYKNLTGKFGGSYMEIGLKHDFTINPFSLPESEDNHQFLFSFVKVLIESGEHRMTDIEQDELYRAIPGTKRLCELAGRLGDSLVPHLSRWIGNGQYGRLFDNGEDTLTYAKFQTFDFEGLEKYPQILEPLLFYILHRANADVYGDREQFKIFLLDEAWKFLANPTCRAYIHSALKTWRKRNAAMWLATQSIDDLDQSAMLRTVAENCGTIVLLPNPRMDRDQYRSIFKLNNVELDLVASMVPKSESLWKPATGPSKVLVLDAMVGTSL